MSRSILIICTYVLIGNLIRANATDEYQPNKPDSLITAKFYANVIFKERRREHNSMIKDMLKSSYERNYKLLSLAYKTIFKTIDDQNTTLTSREYQPLKDGFPEKDASLQGAVQLMLENCCLAAESVLHFPEISYMIFKELKFENWKPVLNECINFANALPHILDEATVKLMELFQQEINEDLRTATYVNPYYKEKIVEEPSTDKTKPKKPKRKLKKCRN